MILLLLAAAAQAAPPATAADKRYHACLTLATRDPKAAEANAAQWQLDGGGFVARECLGVAYANEERWGDAAGQFQAAAKGAEVVKDNRAPGIWAEAGNAWLAAGEAAKARAALDAALASGTLGDMQRGEAQLDRARALVITGDLPAARGDIDHALELVPDDALAWLLSATLARRMADLPRAHHDIAEALTRAPNSAPVELEAGNIAALSQDENGAKAAWQKAVQIAPDSPAGENAAQALAQFGTDSVP